MSIPIANHRPRDINIDRQAGTVTITWADWHTSVYELGWLRAHCPCANCREERLEAEQDDLVLKLTDAPPPSAELVDAELIGGYAIQFQWADGHSAGIYTFSALRKSCPCQECNPDGPPDELG